MTLTLAVWGMAGDEVVRGKHLEAISMPVLKHINNQLPSPAVVERQGDRLSRFSPRSRDILSGVNMARIQ